MGQAATTLTESAVKEGKRCFDAPLDHTVPNINDHIGASQGPREIRGAEPFYSLGLGSGTDGSLGAPPAGALGGQGFAQYGEQSGQSQPDPQASAAAVAASRESRGLPSSHSAIHESRGFPSSHSSAFHEGHVDEAGGYYEEPNSVGDLASLEDTLSNERRGGSGTPPPPEPPRPIGGATLRPMTMQSPIHQPPPTPEGPLIRPAASHQAPPPPPEVAAGPSAVPVATSQAVIATPAQASPPPAIRTANDEKERNLWRQGSILEIYSGSTGRWYPALLLRVQPGQGHGTPDVLTMQFWIGAGDAKQKSLYRNDYQQLMPLGANLEGELPPGFCLKPSQSRPGHSVFQDLSTGMKYQTAELAWQTHFQRLLERPAASGQETVCQLPNCPSIAVQQQGRPCNKQEQGGAAPDGIETEYQAGGFAAMTRDNLAKHDQQAVMQAEGLVTEHGPPHRPHAGASQRQAPPPPCPQPSPQYPFSGPSADQRHGAQLAAEMAGMRPPPGQQMRPHQYGTDCRSAGASRAPVGYPAGGPAPMAVV